MPKLKMISKLVGILGELAPLTPSYLAGKPLLLTAIMFPCVFPLGFAIEGKVYELKSSILRKLLKDAEAELEQCKKGKVMEKVGSGVTVVLE